MGKLPIEEGRLFCIIEIRNKKEQELFVAAAQDIEESGEAIVKMINLSDYGLDFEGHILPSLRGYDDRHKIDSKNNYWKLLGIIIGPPVEKMMDKEAENHSWSKRIDEILAVNGIFHEEELIH